MSEANAKQKDEASRLMTDIYDYCSETGASYDDPTEIIEKLVVERDDLRTEREELLVATLQLCEAAKLIHYRQWMVSGSEEMSDCDEYCKKVGLTPWKWFPKI